MNEEAAAVKAVQAAVPKDAASVEAKAPSAPSPPSSSGKYVPSMIVIPSGRPVPKEVPSVSAGAAQPVKSQTTERQPAAPLATQPAGDTGKTRRGVVEKVSQAETRIAIVTGLFRPEDNIRTHAGTLVHAAGGLEGVLIGPFAKAGKCRVEFPLDCEIQPGAFVTL